MSGGSTSGFGGLTAEHTDLLLVGGVASCELGGVRLA